MLAPIAFALSALLPLQEPALIDQLKPFEGHWKGEFTMGTTKMDVDMTWIRFGGTWAEVSYTYSGAMNYEARVLMTGNKEKSGFDVWMFGTGQPGPDTMKAAMDGKALKIIHVRADQPDLKFAIDADKNMVITVTLPDEKKTEIAHALLKPVKV